MGNICEMYLNWDIIPVGLNKISFGKQAIIINLYLFFVLSY